MSTNRLPAYLSWHGNKSLKLDILLFSLFCTLCLQALVKGAKSLIKLIKRQPLSGITLIACRYYICLKKQPLQELFFWLPVVSTVAWNGSHGHNLLQLPWVYSVPKMAVIARNNYYCLKILRLLQKKVLPGITDCLWLLQLPKMADIAKNNWLPEETTVG